MSGFLATGNNERKYGFVLERVAHLLADKYGHRRLRAIHDTKGSYAMLMEDKFLNEYVLIAKASELYRDVVSCQAYLPKACVQNRNRIVLAWLKDDDVRYYLFDPVQIVRDNYGFNTRFDVNMINFSIRYGVRVEPMQPFGVKDKTLLDYIVETKYKE